MYCQYLPRRELQITDRQSGRLVGVVPTFEQLLVEAFEALRLMVERGPPTFPVYGITRVPVTRGPQGPDFQRVPTDL
jgi:hypothetical protein